MSGSRNINRPGKKLLQNLTPSLVYVYYCILLHIFDRLNIWIAPNDSIEPEYFSFKFI